MSQTTDTTKSDDDDDELLALRIAALESIKLQKFKANSMERGVPAQSLTMHCGSFVVRERMQIDCDGDTGCRF